MKTDLFQSCGHCWVFQIFWHTECSTFTASSFRIWSSSAGISTPPLALFVAQSCLTLCDPMDYTVHGILQARILEWVAFSLSRGSSQPRDRTQVSHTAGEFFTSWATREAKNTGVGSLSLLQQIFLTQELNPGLPHCGWILYQLSYQGYHMVTFSFVLDAAVPGPKLQLLMHCRKQGWFLGTKPLLF